MDAAEVQAAVVKKGGTTRKWIPPESRKPMKKVENDCVKTAVAELYNARRYHWQDRDKEVVPCLKRAKKTIDGLIKAGGFTEL